MQIFRISRGASVCAHLTRPKSRFRSIGFCLSPIGRDGRCEAKPEEHGAGHATYLAESGVMIELEIELTADRRDWIARVAGSGEPWPSAALTTYERYEGDEIASIILTEARAAREERQAEIIADTREAKL